MRYLLNTYIMKKIIRIEPQDVAKKYFSVNWMLHDRCTYNCSYCPPANKAGDDDWLKLDFSKKFVDKLESWLIEQGKNENVIVHFTGGEPTVWPRFIELVDYINSKNWSVKMTTNGSRSLSWWKENATKFDSISMSYHSEFADDSEFVKKVKWLTDTLTFIRFHVTVMMNPKEWAKSVNMAETLSAMQINYSARPVQDNFGLTKIDLIPYTDSQIEYIKSHKPKFLRKAISYILHKIKIKRLFKKGNIDAYPWFVTVDEDLKRKHLDPSRLVMNNQVNFFGWQCNIGLEQIFINSLGDIWGGTCLQGIKIGNIQNSDNVRWPTAPATCLSLHCGCYTDIRITKWKP